jgi:hypothetical protein
VTDARVEADLKRMIEEAHHQLDRELLRKEDVGAEKYGELAFLGNSTVEMAMDEVTDLINYMRFTYAKLYIMNKMLKQMNEQRQPTQEGFISTKDLFGPSNSSSPNIF